MYTTAYTHILTAEQRALNAKFAKINQQKSIVCLPDNKIFISFADGHWFYYDEIKDKLTQGEVPGPCKEGARSVIKSPKALDSNTIVYADFAKFKLQALDLARGQQDPLWDSDVPTTNALREIDRLHADMVEPVFNNLEIEVLRKSRTVAVLEYERYMRQWSIVIFEQRDPQQKAWTCWRIPHKHGDEPIELKAFNDYDKFTYYSKTQGINFEFYIIDVIKHESPKYVISREMKCTILNLFPLENNQILMFGNPDAGGTPLAIRHQLGSEELEIIKMDLTESKAKSVTLSRVIAADIPNKLFVFKEFGAASPEVSIWSLTSNALVAPKRSSEAKEYFGSYDGKYFIEVPRKVDSDQGAWKVNLCKVISKKFWVLLLLKYGRTNKGKGQSLQEIYNDDERIQRDIVDMLTRRVPQERIKVSKGPQKGPINLKEKLEEQKYEKAKKSFEEEEPIRYEPIQNGEEMINGKQEINVDGVDRSNNGFDEAEIMDVDEKYSGEQDLDDQDIPDINIEVQSYGANSGVYIVGDQSIEDIPDPHGEAQIE